MIFVLMSARANINVSNNRGETPLLAACRAGHLDVCRLLIEKGADVKMGNEQGEAPLLDVSLFGNLPFTVGMSIGALFFLVNAALLFAVSVFLQAGVRLKMTNVKANNN